MAGLSRYCYSKRVVQAFDFFACFRRETIKVLSGQKTVAQYRQYGKQSGASAVIIEHLGNLFVFFLNGFA